MEVPAGDRPLSHELQVELLRGELPAETLRGLLAQREDLVAAKAVGDRLRRPLRVAEDRALGVFATGALRLALPHSRVATARQEISPFRKQRHRVVVADTAGVDAGIDA